MKKIVLIFAISSMFVACKNSQEKTAGSETATQTPQPVAVQKEVHYVNTPAPVQQKKGWSKAAKGAVIGGGSGAVVGAVVSKNKGKGAAIGAVLGAGAGYVIGRNKDKKDGRVNR